MKKSRIPIEIVVTILAALSCLVSVPSLQLPVWALFIGWAWYFALGGTPEVLKKIYPAMLPGSLLAVLCIWLANLLVGYMPGLLAVIVAVLITVAILMYMLRIPLTSATLPAFNAYSCVFAAFYGKQFYNPTGDFVRDLWVAFATVFIACALGPLFGYLSVFFTFAKEK
ncbi:MAG: DUF1097 domain-containing protein [Synergistales bacterium]|nr:DUF1097 domain-containing protein [Synergistales bacterium]